jgi:hypothetical protein
MGLPTPGSARPARTLQMRHLQRVCCQGAGILPGEAHPTFDQPSGNPRPTLGQHSTNH